MCLGTKGHYNSLHLVHVFLSISIFLNVETIHRGCPPFLPPPPPCVPPSLSTVFFFSVTGACFSPFCVRASGWVARIFQP